MANETMITVQGWIGNDPVFREVGDGCVLNFRVGCTPRHYQKSTESWVDNETQWYSVSAWRRLAQHGARSLHRGDPVIVHGRVNHRTYRTQTGAEGVSVEIDALTIGHDLNRGMATFVKAAPLAAAPPAETTEPPVGAAGPPPFVGDASEPGPDVAPEAARQAGAA